VYTWIQNLARFALMQSPWIAGFDGEEGVQEDRVVERVRELLEVDCSEFPLTLLLEGM
jgi:uncharacterized tellurite resistance protein B-like protein